MTAEALLPLAIAECVKAACHFGMRDVEEAESLAGIALWKAIEGFDQSKGGIKARVAYKAWNEVRQHVKAIKRRSQLLCRVPFAGDVIASRTNWLDEVMRDMGEEARSYLRDLIASVSPMKYVVNMPERVRSEIEEALR